MLNKEENVSSVEESSERLNFVMKRLNALEDVVLVGNKVYMRVPLPVVEQLLEAKSGDGLRAKLILESRTGRVGETINLRIDVVNEGRTPIFLTVIEEMLPVNFELVAKPDYCHLDNNRLNMNRKRLDPDKKEEIRLSLRVLDRGVFALKPRIGYLNGMGHETFFELGPETIEVSENILPGRINTGYGKLDSLLLGGIPHNYAVILTSISCDERDMLIRRFLEGGARSGQLTLYITIEARGVKRLAEKFQSNFYLFLCNPRADTIIEALPNVFKLKGVENLTEINIALISILRTLPTSQDGQGRACIEIVSDVLLQHGAVHTRRWLTSLIPDLKSKGFTTLAVMNPYMHLPQEVQAIPDLFEGEISIFERDSVKYLKIRKMYGQKYLDSELPLRKTAPNTTRPSRARLL